MCKNDAKKKSNLKQITVREGQEDKTNEMDQK